MIFTYSPTQTKNLSSYNFEPAHERLFLLVGPQIPPVPKFFNDEEILTSDFPPPVENVQQFFQFDEATGACWVGGLADVPCVFRPTLA